MKEALIIIFCFMFCSASAQESKNEQCAVEPFHAFIADSDPFSNVRETPNGTITLKLNNEYGYGYMLTITGAEDGWLQVSRIQGVEEYDVSDFTGWIHSSIVASSVTYDLDIYSKPRGEKRIGKLIGEGESFQILDVNCEWVKVKSGDTIGWVRSKGICGNPVTNCS